MRLFREATPALIFVGAILAGRALPAPMFGSIRTPAVKPSRCLACSPNKTAASIKSGARSLSAPYVPMA